MSGWAVSGCGADSAVLTPDEPVGIVSTVMPSATGTPNSVTAWGEYEFVSVQGTGQIVSYKVVKGVQTLAGVYATPCTSPSGMAVATVGSTHVMAVTCYDSGELLTLAVSADGQLRGLGRVGGLPVPYPGMALDGTNVLVPLFGVSLGANGAVARVSVADPLHPTVTGVAVLESPAGGEFVNPVALTVSAGMIYVAAGSESWPPESSSTIQVVDENAMSVIGQPVVVKHSPQRIAVSGTIAYVTIYDEQQLVSLDVSVPSSVRVLETVSLSGCSPIPVMVVAKTAYVGCYAQGSVLSLDVTRADAISVIRTLSGVGAPQSFAVVNQTLVSASGVAGGSVYAINLGPGMSGQV